MYRKVIKLKKIILLTIMAFLLCGCNANYKLEVDKDFNIKESLELSEPKSSFKDVDSKTVLERGISNYNSILKYPINDLKISNGISEAKVKYSNKYSSVEEYSNSELLKNLNGKAELYSIENSGKYYDVFQVMINYDFFDMINTKKLTGVELNDMKLIMEFPYEVTYTNADSVDKNIYTWDLKNLTSSNSRSFFVRFDKNKPYKSTFQKVLTIVAGVLLVGGVLIGIILLRKNKNNKV